MALQAPEILKSDKSVITFSAAMYLNSSGNDNNPSPTRLSFEIVTTIMQTTRKNLSGSFLKTVCILSFGPQFKICQLVVIVSL